MSRRHVAALVCEGQTDFPILRTLIQEVWPEIESVRCLQPELDEMDRAKGPAGWSQVKAWCEAHSDDIAEVLAPYLGDPIDLLVIAIDVDIAIDAGIANPPERGVGLYETNRLRDVMSSWINRSGTRRLPPNVVFSTPVRAIEAWIIAALFPRESAPECIDDPATWLVKKRKLRKSPDDGMPWKELHLYQQFGLAVAKKIKRVRKVCREAERTLGIVEERRAQLASSSKG